MTVKIKQLENLSTVANTDFPLAKVEENSKKRVKVGGRTAGTPNKTTAKAREAFALFVESNSERMQEWLDEIASDPKHGPKAAFDLLLAVSEYHVPKLARTEVVGDKDQPVAIQISWADEES
jgi:hypothetical protein